MSFQEEIARLPQQPEIDKDGIAILRVGLTLTLYFTDGYTQLKRQAVLNCFNDYFQRYGDELRWWVVEGGRFGRAAALLNKDMSKYLLSLKYEASESELNWAFLWHDGEKKEDAASTRITGFGASRFDCELHGALSYLSVTLPPIDTGTLLADFRALASRCAERLQPVHGYGGLAIISASDRSIARKRSAGRVLYYASRFPGLEVDEPLTHASWTQNGIKGGNWLTILSEFFTQRLGGLDTLQKTLPSEFELQAYNGGAIVIAGEYPKVGDRYQQLDILTYRSLAAVLKPIRITVHPELPHTQVGFDSDKFEAWLSRFD